MRRLKIGGKSGACLPTVFVAYSRFQGNTAFLARQRPRMVSKISCYRSRLQSPAGRQTFYPMDILGDTALGCAVAVLECLDVLQALRYISGVLTVISYWRYHRGLLIRAIRLRNNRIVYLTFPICSTCTAK